MKELLSRLSSVYASGQPIKLDYNGSERLCVVERIDATRVIVKQIVEGNYRSFSLDTLVEGSELTKDERNFIHHYCQS